jgi:hypothetical protein
LGEAVVREEKGVEWCSVDLAIPFFGLLHRCSRDIWDVAVSGQSHQTEKRRFRFCSPIPT